MAQLSLEKDWDIIRQHFSTSFKSNLHVSFASVEKDHGITATPIGSFFLNMDQSGFYFEKFPSKLPKSANADNSICILGVNSNRRFWFKSLFSGKFATPPAIKLYGKLGRRRKATDSEMVALKKRMRWTSWLRGHKYLWNNMQHIREVEILRAESINLGQMTANQ